MREREGETEFKSLRDRERERERPEKSIAGMLVFTATLGLAKDAVD